MQNAHSGQKQVQVLPACYSIKYKTHEVWQDYIVFPCQHALVLGSLSELIFKELIGEEDVSERGQDCSNVSIRPTECQERLSVPFSSKSLYEYVFLWEVIRKSTTEM